MVRYETDGFARYEAFEQLCLTEIFQITSGSPISESFLDLYGELLIHSDDPLYQSLLIQIPSLNTISQNFQNPIDFSLLSSARTTLIESILERYEKDILDLYTSLCLDLPKNE